MHHKKTNTTIQIHEVKGAAECYITTENVYKTGCICSVCTCLQVTGQSQRTIWHIHDNQPFDYLLCFDLRMIGWKHHLHCPIGLQSLNPLFSQQLKIKINSIAALSVYFPLLKMFVILSKQSSASSFTSPNAITMLTSTYNIRQLPVDWIFSSHPPPLYPHLLISLGAVCFLWARFRFFNFCVCSIV